MHGAKVKKAYLSCFPTRTLCAGINIFNCLTPSLAILDNDKAKFKAVVRKYLNTHSFLLCSKIFVCATMIY
jgi:hypothetical protein